jgi:hypothetical protein
MSNRFGLLSVKNAELLAGLSQLVKRGNELTAEVLAHLAELEERRLHLLLGHSSSFAYCVDALGMSEGAAGRRVAAARVCRRFPEALELIARGDLHLSALCGLAPHLSPHNATELFAACCRKTRRQVDELLAARFPKPDVREQIRRLPSRGRVSAASNDPRIDDRLVFSGGADQTQIREDAHENLSVAVHGHPAALVDAAKVSEDRGSETAGASSVDGPPRPAPEPPPARRRELEALSADRFGVHFTADAQLKELLERARALASHRLPKNDLSSLMRIVLESFVKHEEARRFAVGRRPRRPTADATHANASPPRATPPGKATPGKAMPGKATPGEATPGKATPGKATPGKATPGEAQPAITSAAGKSAPVGSQASQVARVAAGFAKRSRRSRCVPAAVRRAVYLRDDARCSFVAPDGRRCDARALPELDHVEPWATLGDAGVDNIRLRCRAHNQLHARECFGARHIEAKIAARRPATGKMTNLEGSPHYRPVGNGPFFGHK